MNKINFVNDGQPAINDTNLNLMQTYIETAIQSLYPVGCIYMTTVDTNPNTLFGFGTWTLWGAGKVPVGVNTEDVDFNTVEKTGGEKTHTLTINEIPSHKHNTNVGVTLSPDAGGYRTDTSGVVQLTDNISRDSSSIGGGNSHNNLQPYITCYMWKRTQ